MVFVFLFLTYFTNREVLNTSWLTRSFLFGSVNGEVEKILFGFWHEVSSFLKKKTHSPEAVILQQSLRRGDRGLLTRTVIYKNPYFSLLPPLWYKGLCCCCCLVAKSCPTLCDPMGCGPPGSSVHGISQARMLEWVAIFFSNQGLCFYEILPFSYIAWGNWY